VLPALLAAGYDRTFDRLDNRPPRRAEGWRAGAAVAVDDDHCRARVEAGAAVDLGGVGKGYSAMRALDAMWAAARDLAGGFVDLGGDLAFRGLSPEGGSWRIGVADPHGGAEPLALLGVQSAGVATSGRDRRRFGPGRALHHLIDPVTGDPAVSGPLAVTVVAPDAAEAEIHATALAISDVEEARAHVARSPHVSALFVPESAPPVVLGALPTVPRFRLVRAAA
jgi:thiamine biosynthesis lipoprotein